MEKNVVTGVQTILKKYLCLIVLLFASSCDRSDELVFDYNSHKLTHAEFKQAVERKFQKDVEKEDRRNFFYQDLLPSILKIDLAEQDLSFHFEYDKYYKLLYDKERQKILYKKQIVDSLDTESYINTIKQYYFTDITFSQIAISPAKKAIEPNEARELAESILKVLDADPSKWDELRKKFSDDFEKNPNGHRTYKWGRVDYSLQQALFHDFKGLGIYPKIISTQRGYSILNVVKRKLQNTRLDTVNFKRYLAQNDQNFYKINLDNFSSYFQLMAKEKYPIQYNKKSAEIFLEDFKQIESAPFTEIPFRNVILAITPLDTIDVAYLLKRTFVSQAYYISKIAFMRPLDIKEVFIDKVYKNMLLNKQADDAGIVLDNDKIEEIKRNIYFLKVGAYFEHITNLMTATEDEAKELYDIKKKKENRLGSFTGLKPSLLYEVKRQKAQKFLDEQVASYYNKIKDKIKIDESLL